jgi:SAM-dependent methyltransferase
VSSTALAAPFDQVAASYDADFSNRRLGRMLRQRVWAVLGNQFRSDMHILELGCGTGEDAVWLAQHGLRVVATDVSLGMLSVSTAKVRAANLNDRVELVRVDANEFSFDQQVDGVFANFGVLNCVADLPTLALHLADNLPAGAPLVAVVMGPFCAWETLWYGLHGDVARAFRRTRRGALASVGSASLPVWYPSIQTLRSAFEPDFAVRSCRGLGALLPPSYLAGLVDRFPRLFTMAARLDGRMPFGPWWADHYVAVFERR